MEKSYSKRIRNIDNYLKFFLNENENFYFGLPFDEYQKSSLLDKYNLPKTFPNNSINVMPSAKGSVTKANLNGKYVRKVPEEFEVIMKRIDYVRKKDRVRIKYDRKYEVYKKVLLHQFKSKLFFNLNLHGEKLFISEKLNYDKKDTMRLTHIANVFCEIFNYFEIYDKDLNPAIHFNTKFDELILPSGTLDDQNNFDELIEISKRFNKNEQKQQAVQKRLQILKSYKPDIRGKGPNGFLGYIVFCFSDLDIVILETMYSDNATYVFTKKNFENNIINNKQTVLNQKLHEKRFVHKENWEELIRKYMEKLGKKPM
ncbi:hypothetical protein [Chryseobacterium polytrichastri]|uniref:Uncharacterized protein n=1 Tax=Chryseobacterium polytrichastri TaxID=1302687 RepID=A0A1M6XX67_9FLAO|nr:hypothetical protein [Chryseobacterium polytrichastri]SHL10453.1 hypothetical protein SAMN05444267_101214 [Chryseobacterium polytrichastri]